LEVDEFGTYSIEVGGGNLQEITLLRCSLCQKYVTTDGYEIPANNIVSREGTSKSNMRTLTMQLNSGIYQDLEDLLDLEMGGVDSVKMMNEIVALGLKQYRRTLSP